MAKFSSNLVIDSGNTRIKCAVFSGDQLVDKQTMDGWDFSAILQLATNHAVKNIIFSSVSTTLSTEEKGQLAAQYHFMELLPDTKLPIKNAYATPNSLGKDRLAAAVGAFRSFPDCACLVVDAGTCITLDVLDAEGTYLGGNISPGIKMRWKAMNAFTARLPLVDFGAVNADWGNSTEEALRNGGWLGAALEIEALAARIRQQWPGLKILLTGGDAESLAIRLKCEIFVRPNLVLEGLNEILRYNEH